MADIYDYTLSTVLYIYNEGCGLGVRMYARLSITLMCCG